MHLPLLTLCSRTLVAIAIPGSLKGLTRAREGHGTVPHKKIRENQWARSARAGLANWVTLALWVPSADCRVELEQDPSISMEISIEHILVGSETLIQCRSCREQGCIENVCADRVWIVFGRHSKAIDKACCRDTLLLRHGFVRYLLRIAINREDGVFVSLVKSGDRPDMSCSAGKCLSKKRYGRVTDEVGLWVNSLHISTSSMIHCGCCRVSCEVAEGALWKSLAKSWVCCWDIWDGLALIFFACFWYRVLKRPVLSTFFSVGWGGGISTLLELAHVVASTQLRSVLTR